MSPEEQAMWQGAQQSIGTALGIGLQSRAIKQQIRGQKKIIGMQVEASKNLADYQQAQQLKMWEQTNYPAQMKQLAIAGLNPGLLYGKGGAGGATTGGGIPSAPGGNINVPSIQEGMSIMMMQSQKQLIDAQAQNLNAQTEKLTGADTEKTQSETEQNIATTLNIKQDTLNKEAQNYLTKAQTAHQELQNYITSQSTENTLKQIETTTLQGILNLKKLGIETEIQEKSKDHQLKIYEENAITAGLNNIAIRNNIKLTQEQIKKIGADIAQGWTGLKIQDKNTAINNAKTKFITEHPTLMQTAGKEIETFLNNIYDLFGKDR